MLNDPARRRTLFSCGVLFGMLAEQLVLNSIPLILFQDTKDVATLGFAFAIEWIPALIAYPFAGLIADRDGGGRLFRRVTTARALVLGLVVLLCVSRPSLTIPVLFACGALLSVLMAPVRMSVEKMVPELAEGDQVPKTQALVQNMELLAMALGPGLATVAAFTMGKIWILGIGAAMFVIAAACWLPLPRGTRTAGAGGLKANLAELGLGWSLLISNRPVRLLAGLNFTINMVLAVCFSANAAMVIGVFGAPDFSFTLLNMGVGVSALANLLLIPVLLRYFSVYVFGVIGFSLFCIGALSIGIAPSFGVYAVGFVAALTGDAYFNVFNRTQRLKVIPREHLGKVMGPFYLLNMLSFPLGGLAVAFVAPRFGTQNLIGILAAALIVIGTLLLLLTMRAFRHALLPVEPEAVPAGV